MEDDIFNDCLASVDGVDCLYKTKRDYAGKPDKRYYSYKYKKSGLRYEVAVAIRSNNIVWINGPFLPGEYNDLQIFRMGLKQQLKDGERVEADDIYEPEAPHTCYTPRHVLVRGDQKLMRNRIKKRQETINRRLKVFKSLNVVFTHSVNRHSICFRCAAILVQLALECGEQELFDVREYDDRLSDEQATEIWGV